MYQQLGQHHHGVSTIPIKLNNSIYSLLSRRKVLIALCGFSIFSAVIYSILKTEAWEELFENIGIYDRSSSDLIKQEEEYVEEVVEESKPYTLPRTSTRSYTNYTFEPGIRYFIYSPSGGFNNQRIEMENAMIICKLLERTLIVPPMGKHTSFFGRYELLHPSQLVPMDKIFDFEKISTFIPVIAMGNARIITYIQRLSKMYDIKTVLHEERRNWQQNDVYLLKTIKARVLFLRGAEMYHDWSFERIYQHEVYSKVQFTPGIRHVAVQSILSRFPDGSFNALHVRMGDYSDRTPLIGEYRMKMIQRGFTKEVPLYIATEPSTPKSYFRELCAEFNCYFSKDLSNNNIVLEKFEATVPNGQIRQDMLGVVEQLICVGAIHFVGTSFSTFSGKIIQMRKMRQDSFPEFQRDDNRTTTHPTIDD